MEFAASFQIFWAREERCPMKTLTRLILALALAAPVAMAGNASIVRNQRLGKGVNVGNYLDATPVEGSWTNGDVIKPSYFSAIRAKGFQSVRLPVRWTTRTGASSPYAIDPVFLNRVDSVVTWALRNQLAVVLDNHHHDEFWLDPVAEMPRLKAIWSQVATRFTSTRFPDSLVVFEPINEPNGIGIAQWNLAQTEIVAHIRALQPHRTLLIEPTNWSGVAGLSGYTIPADTNLIVSIHNYEPFQFTHQGASWVAGSSAWLGTRWGGSTDSANLAALYAQAQQFGLDNAVPVNVGEFGALAAADRGDRLEYLSQNVEQAEARGMSHMVWMFSDTATFGIFDTVAGLWDDSLAAAVKDGGVHPGRPVPAQPVLWKRTQVSASVNGGLGWIATYNDSEDGGNTVVAPRSAYIPDSIVANTGVLPFRVTLGTYIYAYSGMVFGLNGSPSKPTDASSFRGMNVVYASNNPTWLNLTFVANDAFDHPRALLPSTGGLLDTVRIPWASFVQQGWGTRITKDTSNLTQVTIQFQKQAGINTGASVNFRLHCLGFDSACEAPSGNLRPRVVAPIPDQEYELNFPARAILLSGRFASPDGPIGYSVSSTRDRLTPAIDGSSLVLYSKPGITGLDTILVKAFEVGQPSDSVVDSFVVKIRAVNQAPVRAAPVANQVRSEDFTDTLKVALANVFTDVDDSLAFTATHRRSIIDLELVGGVVRIRSVPDSNGVDTVILTATETGPTGLAIADTFLVTVNKVNDKPRVVAPPSNLYLRVNADTVRIPLKSVFRSPDGPMSFTATSKRSRTSLLVRQDTLLLAPKKDTIGLDTVIVKARETATPADSVRDTILVSIRAIRTFATLGTIDFESNPAELDTILESNRYESEAGLTLPVTALKTSPLSGAKSARFLMTSDDFSYSGWQWVAEWEGIDASPTALVRFKARGRDTRMLRVALNSTAYPILDNGILYGWSVRITPRDSVYTLPLTTASYPAWANCNTRPSSPVCLERRDSVLKSLRGLEFSVNSLGTSDSTWFDIDDIQLLTNGAPSANPSPDLVRLEDAADTVLSLTKVFGDVDDSLVYTASSKRGIVTLSVVEKTVVLGQRPDSNGVDTLVFTATEARVGGRTVRDTFVVTVTPVNDLPSLLVPFADVQADPDFVDTIRIALKARFKSPDGPIAFSTKASLSKVLLSIRNDTLLIASRAGYRGTDTIAVRATELGGTEFVRTTFLIRLVALNAPTVVTPVANLVRLEDAADTTINLANVFRDADDVLNFGVVSRRGSIQPSLAGAILTLRQPADFNGVDTLIVSATETRSGGNTVRDTFVVTVTPVNDVPTLLVPFTDIQKLPDFADTVRLSLKDRFRSPDGPLVFSTKASLAKVLLSIRNDTLLIASRAGYRGTDTIAVRATEVGGTDFVRGTFLIRLVIPNAPTVVTRVPDLVRLEDAIDTTIDLRKAFQDSDDSLRFGVTSRRGLVQASLAGAIATLRQPADSNGVDTLIVSATETRSGGNTVRDTFVVRVNAVNDLPTLLVPFSDVQTVPDFVDTVRIALKARFKSPDGPVVFSTKASLSKVLLSIRNDTLLIASRAGYRGTDTIAVRATEVGGTDFVRGTFLIRMVVPNAAPVVTASPNLVRLEDAADTVLSLSKVFSDADDSLSFTASTRRGIVTVSVVGKTVVLHQLPDSNGTDTVYLSATESRSGGRIVRDTFSVRITAVNDLPRVVRSLPDTTLPTDFGVRKFVLSNVFASPDGALGYSFATKRAKVILALSGDTLVVTSRSGVSGNDTIMVRAHEVAKSTDLVRDTMFLRISSSEGTFVDSRDGQSYDWVRIGTQTWMSENLTFAIGRASCYGDTASISSTCDERGRFYHHSEAKVACPDGWHLPNNSEWEALRRLAADSGALLDVFGFNLRTTGYFWAPWNGWDQNDVYYWSLNEDGGGGHYWYSYGTTGTIDGRLASWREESKTMFAVRCLANGPQNASPTVASSPDLVRLEDAADTVLSMAKVFGDIDDSLVYTASSKRGIVAATVAGKTVVIRQGPGTVGLDTVFLSATENRTGGRTVRDTFSVRVDAANSEIPWNESVSYGTLTDSRDGRTYRTVVIGSQTWMAQNLNYRASTGSVDTLGACFGNSLDSCRKYGRLYSWAEAMGVGGQFNSQRLDPASSSQGVCPVGWHLPTEQDWKRLTDTILVDSTAGNSLKSTAGWVTYSSTPGNGSDAFGFRGLPGGANYGTSFGYSSSDGLWWSATELDAASAHSVGMNGGYRHVYINSANRAKTLGFSIRCLRN